MRNSTFPYPLKMEYGWNFTILGLKIMVKCDLKKIFLKFLHAGTNFWTYSFTSLKEGFLTKTTNSVQKWPCAWRDFNKNCCSVSIFYIYYIYKTLSQKFHHIPFWASKWRLNHSYTLVSWESDTFGDPIFQKGLQN